MKKKATKAWGNYPGASSATEGGEGRKSIQVNKNYSDTGHGVEETWIPPWDTVSVAGEVVEEHDNKENENVGI